MTRLLSPAVYRRMIAFELQRMRKTADITQQEAAEKLGCSRVRINHFESMRNLPRPADVEVLLPYYGAAERVEEFRDVIAMLKDVPHASDLARLAEVPRGFDIYLGLEQGAHSIRSYEAMIFPGLLQTPEYAGALMRGHDDDLSEEEARRRTELRLARQQVLARQGTPLELTTVIDESVLRRRIGDARIMREQFDHLLDMSARSNITVRILGADVGVHPALHGPFTLMDFAIPGDPGVVYLEDRLGGRYYEDADEIDEYIGVMEHLLARSLEESESRRLLRQAREELIR
ncbi:Helix-turn-helix domain-containing protein [Actinopolyspora xinjiangensis]|uniref:Helix-turn-helix domain-containing protein n=1 Tax=Actinopolyspora xinjiangensis TaxID=405564 RepID=A0A1H0VQ84_9ACTN|nr:helix-turn-helix transcriptional regulator [Actinopolyspora xinjiangensis]SDP80246.1 Helix-turn-helix domain-containing protein [Actinopolyspora xinjiangensis]